MLIKAKCCYVRSSSYKLRLVADLIRNKGINDALNILKFTKKKSSFLIKKVLDSAIANAKNNYKLNLHDLFVYRIFIDDASTMKRIMPRAKGRVNYILKKTSHINLFLSIGGKKNGSKNKS